MFNIISWLLQLFRGQTKQTTPAAAPPTAPPVSQPAQAASPDPALTLTLTHPEEPMNPSQTVANTNVAIVVQAWLDQWQVPAQYQDFWKTQIDIKVFDSWPSDVLAQFSNITAGTPSFTFSDTVRHLYILAAWLNPGVVAHEEAHNSYALLTDDQKAQFSAAYTPLKTTDPLIKYLYSINNYGLTNDVEGHAEVYRYLADRMPEQLKVFYPKLF